jgi:GTP-binding protein YchF
MLSAGIVGLPNVGKSTLFNAVTRTHKAPAENYPFCTIDPNVGVVTVPDPRLQPLVEISRSQKIVSTAIEFVDIAGLVKGASAGEGLGNQFLHHIREVDAIVQVVRCFEDSDVHHVSGTIDPVRDIEIINTELVLADLTSVQKRRDRLQKEVRAGDKSAKIADAVLEKLLPHLNAGKPAITAELTPEERTIAREFFLLTSKPTIFACNVAESDLAVVAGAVDPGRGMGFQPMSHRQDADATSYNALAAQVNRVPLRKSKPIRELAVILAVEDRKVSNLVRFERTNLLAPA